MLLGAYYGKEQAERAHGCPRYRGCVSAMRFVRGQPFACSTARTAAITQRLSHGSNAKLLGAEASTGGDGTFGQMVGFRGFC